jgi:hypothetical protein
MDQLANLAADLLLPNRQGIDVGINAWVDRIYHSGCSLIRQ